jgi:hypothetical protein
VLHLTNASLIASAVVFCASIFKVVRAFLKNRRGEVAPFRHYFEPEYDRSLLPQGVWCDDKNLYDARSCFASFNVSDLDAADRYSKGSGITWRSRDQV